MLEEPSESLRSALAKGEDGAGVELVGAVLAGRGSLELLGLALDSPKPDIRSQGLVALGDFARLGGVVDRALILRVKLLLRDAAIAGGFPVSGFADDAIDDVLYSAGWKVSFIVVFPRRYMRFARRAVLSRARWLMRLLFSGGR